MGAICKAVMLYEFHSRFEYENEVMLVTKIGNHHLSNCSMDWTSWYYLYLWYTGITSCQWITYIALWGTMEMEVLAKIHYMRTLYSLVVPTGWYISPKHATSSSYGKWKNAWKKIKVIVQLCRALLRCLLTLCRF